VGRRKEERPSRILAEETRTFQLLTLKHLSFIYGDICMYTKHVSRKRADDPSVRQREKFPVPWAGDPNPGVPSEALKPWRDTLARWFAVVWLVIGTVCRFSSWQWQTVRRVFWRSTLVGGNGMFTKHGIVISAYTCMIKIIFVVDIKMW